MAFTLIHETRGTKRPAADETWTTGFKQLVTAITLPRPAPPTFTGLCRKEFGLFICEFQQYLADNAVPESAKLRLLIQACTGEMKTTLMNCLRLGPEEGYARALKMLTDRLGSDRDRVEDLVQKIRRGPSVNGEILEEMRRFIEELWDWTMNMETLGRLPEIDTNLWVGVVAGRLTGKLREHYQYQAHKYKKQHGERPGITWFRSLLEDELDRRTSCDSRLSTQGDKNKTAQAERTKSDTTPSKRAFGFATMADRTEMRGSQGRKYNMRSSCLLCLDLQASHPIFACPRFRSMKVPARREWVKRVNRCYLCLGDDHQVSRCTSEHRCNVTGCAKRHSQWLHLMDSDYAGNHKPREHSTNGRSPPKAQRGSRENDAGSRMLEDDDLRHEIKKAREMKITSVVKSRHNETSAGQRPSNRQVNPETANGI